MAARARVASRGRGAGRDQLGRVTRLLRAAVSGLFDQSRPFGRLALVHTIFSAGSTLVTISLAGSLFFTVNLHESKTRVVLYLFLTLAPFAVVAPVLSPLLDRGATARRASIAVACAGSAILGLLMSGSLKGFLLFPLAFGLLVLSKLYLVGKAALVPSVVEGADDLAASNAKLAVLAALAGFVVAPIGVGLLQLGAQWVLRVDVFVFLAGALASLRLPRPGEIHAVDGLEVSPDGRPYHGPPQPGDVPSPAARMAGDPGAVLYKLGGERQRSAPRVDVRKERRQLGLPLIVPEVALALGAMTVLRGVFAFLTFSLAFEMRLDRVPTWWYGCILVASGIGGLCGSMSVPTVRKHLSEQQLILADLVLTAVVAILCGWSGSLDVQPVAALVVGYTSTSAKPAFDSIAQQHVPPAALGRAFGRFETQLQLGWVLCALIAVLVSFPFRATDILVGVACAIGAVFRISMRHTFARRSPDIAFRGTDHQGLEGAARGGAPRNRRPR